jgi:hypothetical protein
MAVVATWTDLAALRAEGQKPLLRVVVTTNATFARRMTWVGCLAIGHQSGESMPVELLDGLDVILDVGTCDRAASVKRLIDSRSVTPSRLEAWCECNRTLVTTALGCDLDREFDSLLAPRDANGVAL